MQLIEWTNKKGIPSRLKLYDEMASHWKGVADLLDIDTTNIGINNRHDIRDCIREVMKEWKTIASNRATYPYTLEGLRKLLNDIGLGRASEDLKEACSL